MLQNIQLLQGFKGLQLDFNVINTLSLFFLPLIDSFVLSTLPCGGGHDNQLHKFCPL